MRNVQVSRNDGALELYFPPLRMPEVALPLAAFGAICAAIPAVLGVALLSSAADNASGQLSAILMAAFVLPFAVFGMVFVLLAVYMLANALLVHVDARSIATARVLFGIVVKRRHIERSDVASVEPEIASRYQSLFSADPIYQLVARGHDRRRMVIGETLRGESEMERIRSLIETSSAAASGARADRSGP